MDARRPFHRARRSCIVAALTATSAWLGVGAQGTARSAAPFVRRVSDLEALVCPETATVPLSGGAAAACHAIGERQLLDHLIEAQRRARYAGWTLRAEWHDGEQQWNVTVTSSGTVRPRFECRLAFTSKGVFSLRPRSPVASPVGCRYLK